MRWGREQRGSTEEIPDLGALEWVDGQQLCLWKEVGEELEDHSGFGELGRVVDGVADLKDGDEASGIDFGVVVGRLVRQVDLSCIKESAGRRIGKQGRRPHVDDRVLNADLCESKRDSVGPGGRLGGV